ncbi:hypothetical protein D3C87_2002770 [compost metagenome]
MSMACAWPFRMLSVRAASLSSSSLRMTSVRLRRSVRFSTLPSLSLTDLRKRRTASRKWATWAGVGLLSSSLACASTSAMKASTVRG